MYELEDLPELQEVSEEQKKEFTISDDVRADWACKIIKQEETEKNRLQQVIDDEIAILQAKKEKLEQQFINNTGFLRMKLNDYFNTVETKELKTCFKYKLPSAELVFTKPKVKYERDNNKILQWLNDNKKYDFIKVTHSVDWENLKLQDFLNQVDGITETMTEAKFEVK